MGFPDVGYTPDNLRHLLHELNLNQREAAEKLGVQTRAMQRWLAAVDLPTHSDMPLKKWNELLGSLEQK
ncbi:helix-turn-helix transcriptional regulator [Simonsiella muelleri]|uniref:helix-turn-helix transcriptional regulator n=1 Tax=Simonsiella muelleri TaxID=72 RepID=UPI0023F3F9F1|nr:helix-turn-helix transcriptional regulator [Simonsiella muelleri]